MSDFPLLSVPPRILRSPFAVACKGATLSGELTLPGDNTRALVVLMLPENRKTGAPWVEDLAQRLNTRGIGMLRIGLRSPEEEERTASGRDGLNLPLLARRLLTVLDNLKQRWENGDIPMRAPKNTVHAVHTAAHPPLGFFAAGDFSSVAVRIAALRDVDVSALVCHGGLIDLAGRQYLSALTAPLLLLADAGDIYALAAAGRCRGLIGSEYEIVPLPEGGVDANGETHEETVVRHSANWFIRWLGGPMKQ